MPIVPTGGATRVMDVSASVPLQAASEDVAMSAMEVPAKEHLKRLSSAKVREAGEPVLKKQRQMKVSSNLCLTFVFVFVFVFVLVVVLVFVVVFIFIFVFLFALVITFAFSLVFAFSFP